MPNPVISLLLAASITLLPGLAQAELKVRVAFTEKQTSKQGLTRDSDTCRTEYEIKTLGQLLIVETVKSNCRTFRVGAVQGTDGSASAIVVEGRNSRRTQKCTYRARSETERCNDGTSIKRPGGSTMDYSDTKHIKASYKLSKNGLLLNRQITRALLNEQGGKEKADASLKLTLALQGMNCELTAFSYSSKTTMLKPGRGRIFKNPPLYETRKLVRSEGCKVLSR